VAIEGWRTGSPRQHGRGEGADAERISVGGGVGRSIELVSGIPRLGRK
jgi:hypothetical protein